MIYILNRELERLGMVTDFSYLLWRTKYNEQGECEIIAPATKRNIELLQIENIIFRHDMKENNAMVIYYRKIERNEYGERIINVKAFSMSTWLSRRIFYGNKYFILTPKGIIEFLINSECINPVLENRKINNIDIVNSEDFGDVILMQFGYENLLEKIESLCDTYDLGFRSKIDIVQNKVLFEVYEGENRVIDETGKTGCRLSVKFGNIIKSNLEQANNNFKNFALIGGEGEGQERIFVQNNNNYSNLDRFEIFVDASDLRKSTTDDGIEINLTDEEYINALQERGNEKLQENIETINFECELNIANSNTRLNKDFYLGDIVTIYDEEIGVTVNTRVVQVDEVFQNNQKNIYIEVGKPVPTLTDKFKKKVK